MRNFEQPFTPRGWLRSASNFGKTRFRWFPTFHFPTPKNNFGRFFYKTNLILEIFFQETGDLEEPDTFERHWQIRRKKLLPEVGLLLGRPPSRRGKRLNLCFGPWLGTKNDFNLLDQKWFRFFGSFGTKVVKFIRTAIRTVPFPKGNVAQELYGTVLIMTLPFPVLVLRYLL